MTHVPEAIYRDVELETRLGEDAEHRATAQLILNHTNEFLDLLERQGIDVSDGDAVQAVLRSVFPDLIPPEE